MSHPILPLTRERERLILHQPSHDDAEIIQSAIGETFEDLHQWIPWAVYLQSLDETRDFLKVAESILLMGIK
jgi:hypothetical protein